MESDGENYDKGKGRPKSKEGPRPTVIRSIAIPAEDLPLWEEFKRLCISLKESMSSVLMGKIKLIVAEMKKKEMEATMKKKKELSEANGNVGS